MLNINFACFALWRALTGLYSPSLGQSSEDYWPSFLRKVVLRLKDDFDNFSGLLPFFFLKFHPLFLIFPSCIMLNYLLMSLTFAYVIYRCIITNWNGCCGLRSPQVMQKCNKFLMKHVQGLYTEEAKQKHSDKNIREFGSDL